MPRWERILRQWKLNPPTEESRKTVENILDRFFPEKWEMSGGSHIVVRDERLNDHPSCLQGVFSIPLKRGRYIKRPYIKNLIEILIYLGEYEP